MREYTLHFEKTILDGRLEDGDTWASVLARAQEIVSDLGQRPGLVTSVGSDKTFPGPDPEVVIFFRTEPEDEVRTLQGED